MFESILIKRKVLFRMQDCGCRDDKLWPSVYHFLPDDFKLMENITNVLNPVRDSDFLSTDYTWFGDVVLMITSVVDAVRTISFCSYDATLKTYKRY